MNEDMLQAQTDQQLRDQQMMNESSKWITDPIYRDMQWGDKKTGHSQKSTWKGTVTLLVFILFTVALILVFYNSH